MPLKSWIGPYFCRQQFVFGFILLFGVAHSIKYNQLAISIVQNYHSLVVFSSKSLQVVNTTVMLYLYRCWDRATGFVNIICVFSVSAKCFQLQNLLFIVGAFELKYLQRLWDNNFDDTYNLLNRLEKNRALCMCECVFWIICYLWFPFTFVHFVCHIFSLPFSHSLSLCVVHRALLNHLL